MANKIIGFIAVLALIVGVTAFVKPSVIQNVPFGSSGSDFYSRVSFNSGVINTGIVATTSNSTAETLKASELRGWVDASLVSYIPIVTSNNTITFPASSTISDIVPHAGDTQQFCFRSATSTAGIYTTFAGGTGVNLNVASSSETALGSTKVTSGEIACFRLIREAATATTFDIDVLMTAFK